VNLDFPYLIPFESSSEINAKEVVDIKGFWGTEELESWVAIGFYARSGDNIYASRQGVVVEIAGEKKVENSSEWYNTWNNSLTLLQPDGTLICYRNISCKNLTINQKVHPGERIGVLSTGANELIMLVYQNSLSSDELRFIIPQFQVDENTTEIINVAKTYTVVHPNIVRGMEMTKKERKKILGKKK